jgi:multicomponent Na+:H+ antiporter subunit D
MTAIAFKSTLIPFFSWTPKVRLYEKAPTAVAAVMSGLQAKAALYLFIRFQEMFAPVAAHQFFLIIGITAGLFGAVMAVCQRNIKMILAYHTISQIGLITVGVSYGGEHAYNGGLYHAVGHAVFKTALFLCAGIVARAYGTADVYQIRGVMRRMPVTGAAALAAVLGITGAPFFIGSVSKYFIFFYVDSFTKIIVVLLSLGTVVSFIKFSSILFGRAPDGDAGGNTADIERCRTIPPVVMGVMCLAGGIFGTRLIYFLFRFTAVIEIRAYAQDMALFAAVTGGAFLLYRYVIHKNEALKQLEKINFGFKHVCASIGVFLAIMLVMIGYF